MEHAFYYYLSGDLPGKSHIVVVYFIIFVEVVVKEAVSGGVLKQQQKFLKLNHHPKVNQVTFL